MSGEQKEVFIVFFDFYSIVDSVHFDENRAIERAKEGVGTACGSRDGWRESIPGRRCGLKRKEGSACLMSGAGWCS